MGSTADRTSYDEVPYPSYPLPQTHPDHLAVVATLLGLCPPPPDRCRVLELGCASGGNLIPLALALPESTFVGIDLSREQIADGQRVLDVLGLRNIELRPLSILQVDDAFGSFDYIICHGVYSWVPPEVQEKILHIVARQLVPQGVGYVSYNTYPGWHLRGMIRAMMRYHVGRFPAKTPESRVRRARELLEFLVRAASGHDHSYTLLLQEHLQLLQKHSDAYLFHEHLEEHNEPVWFLEFCDRLAAHGLRYLGEAEFATMVAAAALPAGLEKELEAIAPRLLEKEQYLDFVRNRTFRQTLLCHACLRPCYKVRAERLAGLRVASPLRPASPSPDLASESPVEFVVPSGQSLTTSAPIVKAALLCLGEAWPESIPLQALVAQAGERLRSCQSPGDEPAEEQGLALRRSLLTAYANSSPPLVDLSLTPPRFSTRLSPRPLASPLARLQAETGRPVTNLRHEIVNLTPFDRHLLPLLDGTRDRPALLEALLERYHSGRLHVSQADGQPIHESSRAREILAEVLDQHLPRLARAAVLQR